MGARRAAPVWTEVVRRDVRVRRLPALVDVVWAFRHLRDLRRVDWSDASLDYRFIEMLSRAFDGLYRRYFRMEVRGLENIPGSAALLVGNHSGFGVAELLMLLVAWLPMVTNGTMGALLAKARRTNPRRPCSSMR